MRRRACLAEWTSEKVMTCAAAGEITPQDIIGSVGEGASLNHEVLFVNF